MKKLLVFSLAFVIIISVLLLLAGCKKECDHSYEKTVTPPTCIAAGEEKFSCTKCDHFYTAEIESTGVHDVQNGVCIACGGKKSTPGLKYSQNDDGTYTVTGIGTCTETDIVIGIYNNRDVTTIGSYAFHNCPSLTSIELSDSLTTIGNYAFNWCTSLTSIVIPEGVTTIGDYVFYNCTSLTSIEFPDSLTTIGSYAFHNCPSITSITVAEGNENYKSVDGNLYSKDGEILIQYAIGKTATTFAVPEGVTAIGNYAFYNCTSLTSIELPDSITAIGNHAFYCCELLASIEFPDSLTTIDEMAFAGCISLTSIVIPEGVTTIRHDAFYYCESLTIYCEVTKRPSGWSNVWNSSFRPVVWGYTGE